jgi:putative DNA primase/helicase
MATVKRMEDYQKETRAQRDARAGVPTQDQLAEAAEAEFAGRWVFSHREEAWFRRCEVSGQYQRDTVQRVLHDLRIFIRAQNTDHVQAIGSAATISAVEKLLRRSPAFAIYGDELDADPDLLGTPAGIYDLQIGQPAAVDAANYVTRRTSISPAPGTPRLWLQFLEEATGGDAELIGYLQRLCGYCLTGETREESLAFFHGSGGNGKGVFLGAVHDIAGEYARQAGMEVFLESKGDRHPADLADLAGARLVIASESSDGRRWDEQRIKSLTGRDTISARFMHGNPFTFQPRFKILVASNHKPRIRSVDDAWRRRLHLVPFERKPAQPDPELKDKLRAEYPQILQWMLDGAEWWYREGLAVPAVITTATDTYFREEDLIGLWFEECCEPDPAGRGDRVMLYESYDRWCRTMGHGAATMHALTRWFKARGYGQDMSKAKRPILGIRFKGAEDELPLDQ